MTSSLLCRLLATAYIDLLIQLPLPLCCCSQYAFQGPYEEGLQILNRSGLIDPDHMQPQVVMIDGDSGRWSYHSLSVMRMFSLTSPLPPRCPPNIIIMQPLPLTFLNFTLATPSLPPGTTHGLPLVLEFPSYAYAMASAVCREVNLLVPSQE